MSKVRAYCSASDHLIRKIFSGVCRVSHWFEEYLKIGDYFFEWTFIFRVFHPSNMPWSHPLWPTFVWPIKIQVHCKNQSSSMTCTRGIQGNRLCSSLITSVPVIGSVDKIACSRGQQTNLRVTDNFTTRLAVPRHLTGHPIKLTGLGITWHSETTTSPQVLVNPKYDNFTTISCIFLISNFVALSISRYWELSSFLGIKYWSP